MNGFRSAGGGSGGKRGVSGGGCGGGCACGGGNAVRLANEPLLSLVLTCLRHQDDQKVCANSLALVMIRDLYRRDFDTGQCGDATVEEWRLCGIEEIFAHMVLLSTTTKELLMNKSLAS